MSVGELTPEQVRRVWDTARRLAGTPDAGIVADANHPNATEAMRRLNADLRERADRLIDLPTRPAPTDEEQGQFDRAVGERFDGLS